MRRLLLIVSLLFALAPPAVAQDGAGLLENKELQEAIRGLDPADPAVGYARSLRREGQLFVVGGAALAGATLLASAIEVGVSPDAGSVAPALAGVGVPVGLGLLVSGIPGMITGPRYLTWYARNGPAPTRIARLRLMRRWRLDLLRIRRDTSLIAGGFFGAATILSGVVWAVRDIQGFNGVAGTSYDPTDGIVTLGMGLAAGGTVAVGLVSAFELRDELQSPHRIWAAPTASFVPTEDGGHVVVGLVGQF